jgi:putative flippase GtrA
MNGDYNLHGQYKKFLKSQVAMQSIKYIITGGASYLVDFVLYWFFSLFTHYQVAVYIGLFAGLGVNYILSKYWVFENKMPVSKRELLAFILFTAFGFALTGIGMYICVDILLLNDKASKLFISIIVFLINFIARKYIIFRS